MCGSPVSLEQDQQKLDLSLQDALHWSLLRVSSFFTPTSAFYMSRHLLCRNRRNMKIMKQQAPQNPMSLTRSFHGSKLSRCELVRNADLFCIVTERCPARCLEAACGSRPTTQIFNVRPEGKRRKRRGKRPASPKPHVGFSTAPTAPRPHRYRWEASGPLLGCGDSVNGSTSPTRSLLGGMTCVSVMQGLNCSEPVRELS